MNYDAIKKAAEGYKADMAKFLRDMIAIPSESCEEEGVVKRIAEELTQETFFKALDGLKDYDDRQDVRAWLFTVARNAYYSHCRRTKHTAPLEDAETAPADTPDIAQLLVDRDAAFTVHQCLHTLDEPYKEVFSLRVFGELPFERIGLIFGHNAA